MAFVSADSNGEAMATKIDTLFHQSRGGAPIKSAFGQRMRFNVHTGAPRMFATRQRFLGRVGSYVSTKPALIPIFSGKAYQGETPTELQPRVNKKYPWER